MKAKSEKGEVKGENTKGSGSYRGERGREDSVRGRLKWGVRVKIERG